MGRAFCAMLSACERADDVARAEEWIRLADELMLQPLGGRPRILHTHCRAAYGAVLCTAGRWDEAEAAMLAVLGPEGSRGVGHRVDTIARLARLRIAQGRIDDAAALLAGNEDRLSVWLPLAEVHLRRDEPDVARSYTQRTLDALVGDVTRRLPVLAFLVEVELARGDLDGAVVVARELDDDAERIGMPAGRAAAAIARARIALARDEPAAAVAECRARRRAARVERTRRRRSSPPTASRRRRWPASTALRTAVTEARAALALAQRLGAAAECDRLTALLRRLGVSSVPMPEGGAAQRVAGLTARETQVLGRLGHGATNAEIGAQLFISPKTVEHHVGRILAKLGVRSRAEAVAVAAAAGVSGDPTGGGSGGR